MKIERIILSPILYPLWRIGWIERAFFHTARKFNRARVALFQLFNFGFDISKWQGTVDFIKMVAFGARFLILRCAYGTRTDEEFETYIDDAAGLLPISSYHFYDPVYNPIDQANKVIAVLAPYKSVIRRVWLDLEFWWSGNYSDPRHWKTYRDMIKAAGYKIGWYTRATWWDSRVGAYAADFARDPLWAAQYNNALTMIPRGWTKAMIWQDGTPAIGHEAGVSSAEIDHDLWNDEFSFFDEWNTNGATEPPTGGEMPEHYMKLTPTSSIEYRSIRAETDYPTVPHIFGTTSTTDRIQPGGSAKALPGDFYVYTADVVINGNLFAKAEDKWWKVYEANGSPKIGWVAEIHKGVRYLNVEEVGTPVTPPPTGIPATVDIDAAPGTIVTVKDAAGNIIWSGIAA